MQLKVMIADQKKKKEYRDDDVDDDDDEKRMLIKRSIRTQPVQESASPIHDNRSNETNNTSSSLSFDETLVEKVKPSRVIMEEIGPTIIINNNTAMIKEQSQQQQESQGVEVVKATISTSKPPPVVVVIPPPVAATTISSSNIEISAFKVPPNNTSATLPTPVITNSELIDVIPSPLTIDDNSMIDIVFPSKYNRITTTNNSSNNDFKVSVKADVSVDDMFFQLRQEAAKQVYRIMMHVTQD